MVFKKSKHSVTFPEACVIYLPLWLLYLQNKMNYSLVRLLFHLVRMVFRLPTLYFKANPEIRIQFQTSPIFGPSRNHFVLFKKGS